MENEYNKLTEEIKSYRAQIKEEKKNKKVFDTKRKENHLYSKQIEELKIKIEEISKNNLEIRTAIEEVSSFLMENDPETMNIENTVDPDTINEEIEDIPIVSIPEEQIENIYQIFEKLKEEYITLNNEKIVLDSDYEIIIKKREQYSTQYKGSKEDQKVVNDCVTKSQQVFQNLVDTVKKIENTEKKMYKDKKLFISKNNFYFNCLCWSLGGILISFIFHRKH
ncbi:hypothetical protein WA158_006215 [Blastocystis sp. Blastoise]